MNTLRVCLVAVAVSCALNIGVFSVLIWVFDAKVPVWGWALLGFQCGRIAMAWDRRR